MIQIKLDLYTAAEKLPDTMKLVLGYWMDGDLLVDMAVCQIGEDGSWENIWSAEGFGILAPDFWSEWPESKTLVQKQP